MSRSSQIVSGGITVIIAVLIAIPNVLWLSAGDAIGAARAKVGRPQARLIKSSVSDGTFGGKATVTFAGEDADAGAVVVELERPFWSREWTPVADAE